MISKPVLGRIILCDMDSVDSVNSDVDVHCQHPFPHDKILDQIKLKAFADDKLNVTKMIISVFDRVENIVGKGEIACTSNVFNRLLYQTH